MAVLRRNTCRLTPPERCNSFSNNSPLVITQFIRNAISLPPLKTDNDITLLFDVLVLQDHPSSSSLQKSSVFTSMVHGLVRSRGDYEWSTCQLQLKDHVSRALKREIARLKNRYFRHVCTVLTNLLEAAGDRELMCHCSLSADGREVGVDIRPGMIILRFLFFLLNDSLGTLVEHVSAMNYPQLRSELCCAYLRLAELCHLWRLVSLSVILGEAIPLSEAPKGRKESSLPGSCSEQEVRCGWVMHHIGE